MKMQFSQRSLSLVTAIFIGLSSGVSVAQVDGRVGEDIQRKVNHLMQDPSSRDINFLFQSLRTRSKYVLKQLKQYPNLEPSYYFFDPRAYLFSTQDSRQESMIAQMDFAKAELADSKLVRLKTLKDELQDQGKKLKEINVSLRTQLGEAVPANELGWGPYIVSKIPGINLLSPSVKEDLERQIAHNNKEIDRLMAEEDFVVAQLMTALRSYGIKIDENEVKILFATVTGDQDLQVISAYDNVRKITVLIQEQLKPGQTTIELGREYYGMYALMLASLIHIHQSQLAQIQSTYMVKINDLISKAEKNLIQAQELLKNSSANTAILKGNIKANTEMIKISKHYREYLQMRANSIEKSIAQRRQAYLEVLNAYKTYDVAQGILEIVQTSQANLNALDALSISDLPQLVDLGDSNIIDQLTQVTLKLNTP